MTTEAKTKLTEEECKELTEQIIEKITKDINRRSGLGASWRMIDSITKIEIIDRWTFLISTELKNLK